MARLGSLRMVFVYLGAAATIILFAMAALGYRDATERARGIETRDLGLPLAGRPDPESSGDATTLWERREAGSRRLATKSVVLGILALLCVPLLVLFWKPFFEVPELRFFLGFFVALAALGVWLSYARSHAGSSDEPQPQTELMLPLLVVDREMPAIQAALEEVALAAGQETPSLYMVESAQLNAFVLPDGGVCLTRGMVDELTSDECGAVFAWLLCRRSEPDIVNNEVRWLALDAATVTDAEALAILRDPAQMLRAWRKTLAADNSVPGSSWLPVTNFFVAPGETEQRRAARLRQLTDLAGPFGTSASQTRVDQA